jgi:hypothetical protein
MNPYGHSQRKCETCRFSPQVRCTLWGRDSVMCNNDWHTMKSTPPRVIRYSKTPQKFYFIPVSGTEFYYRLSKPHGLMQPEGFGKFI